MAWASDPSLASLNATAAVCTLGDVGCDERKGEDMRQTQRIQFSGLYPAKTGRKIKNEQTNKNQKNKHKILPVHGFDCFQYLSYPGHW